MIIVSANIKGGPGKSCIAQNLAVWLQKHQGLTVLLVDGDPQETTSDWLQSRRESGKYADIRFAKMTGDIRADLIDQEDNFGAVVVDCGGHDSQTMRSALAAATHALIPFRPKRRDLKVLPAMSELVALIKTVNPECKFRSVINQARSLPSQVSRAVDAKNLCSEFDIPALSTILYDRNIYDDADESGGSIFEVGKDQKARNEFQAMAEELLGLQQPTKEEKTSTGGSDMSNKFGDIGSRKSADPNAVSQIVNGGQVEIKSKKKSSNEKREPLQVMLKPDVKRGIKAMAAMHGISMTELFEDMYTHYVNTKK